MTRKRNLPQRLLQSPPAYAPDRHPPRHGSDPTAKAKATTYGQFTEGFADTKQNDISLTGATTLNDGSTLVGVSITALEVPTTGPRICHYFAMYHVVSDHGGYVIESGAISPRPCEPAK